MWSISVEPMPSRIGRPHVSSKRRNTSGGSGSAADRQIRTDEKSRPLAPVGVDEGVVERRHREEGRRPVCLDGGEDGVGARPAGGEDGGGAGPVGEEEAVADPVGVVQLRRRVGDVGVGQARARRRRRSRRWRRRRPGGGRRPSAARSTPSCRARRPCRPRGWPPPGCTVGRRRRAPSSRRSAGS